MLALPTLSLGAALHYILSDSLIASDLREMYHLFEITNRKGQNHLNDSVLLLQK